MIIIGEEITLLIFPYLGAAELLVAGLVSKTWFNFSSSVQYLMDSTVSRAMLSGYLM